MIHPELPGLCAFVDEIDAAVHETTGEREIAERVLDGLARLLEHGLDLDRRFCAPRADRYVMYPIFVADDGLFSVASAVWNVGQCTPIHDHGVWGVVGIVAGIEREVRYVHHREANALAPRGTFEFGPGDTTVCCTSDDDVHQVSCGSSAPCIGIHVYGGDIGTRWRHQFDPSTGTAEPFISKWPWLAAPEGPEITDVSL
jgi:3-mercaptopropionate dioxygenase